MSNIASRLLQCAIVSGATMPYRIETYCLDEIVTGTLETRRKRWIWCKSTDPHLKALNLRTLDTYELRLFAWLNGFMNRELIEPAFKENGIPAFCPQELINHLETTALARTYTGLSHVYLEQLNAVDYLKPIRATIRGKKVEAPLKLYLPEEYFDDLRYLNSNNVKLLVYRYQVG